MSVIDSIDDILIVEDTATTLNVLMDVLSDAGYKVRPASDGKSALRSIQAKSPALIILDIMMPDVDGYEVCRILKADEKTNSIPIIFISALGDEDKKLKGFQVGGVDYITKPFYSEEVIARVKAHLNLRRMQFDLEESNATLVAEIKERKRMEEKLRESEEKFRVIFENNSSAIAIVEPDTTITMVNGAFCQMIGFTKEEAVGMRWAQQVPPEDLDRLREFNRQLLANPLDAPDKYEITFYRKNGDLRQAWMSVAMIQSSRKIISSFIDVTERKQAESEREKLIVELQQAIAEVKTLSGLLPICASCKKIRDDKGYWNSLEAYLMKHSSAQFTHGICPECMAKLYPNFMHTKPTE
ncbi:MAG: response regulator [Ignavibacteriales bacterium]|nr:response regulator [Ignavibacteriales bacterium]